MNIRRDKLPSKAKDSRVCLALRARTSGDWLLDRFVWSCRRLLVCRVSDGHADDSADLEDAAGTEGFCPPPSRAEE